MFIYLNFWRAWLASCRRLAQQQHYSTVSDCALGSNPGAAIFILLRVRHFGKFVRLPCSLRINAIIQENHASHNCKLILVNGVIKTNRARAAARDARAGACKQVLRAFEVDM
jgi:hypothetical protein